MTGHQHILRVNQVVDVPPCGCGTGGTHWSGLDIETALGRPLLQADHIELWHAREDQR